MNIKNEIRKKTIFSTFYGFLGMAILIFLLHVTHFNMETLKQVINGFKEKEIKSLDVNMSKYNTSFIYATEIIDMNVEYSEKVDRKIVITKLYLAKTDIGNFYFVPDPKIKIEKAGEKYLIKGTLKPITQEFAPYVYLAYEKIPEIDKQPFLVINQLDGWKFEMKIILSVIGVVVLIIFVFFLNRISALIDIKKSKTYKVLSEYGNPEELLKVIEKELADSYSTQYETKNWYIFNGFYTLLFIPKDLIIATHSIKDSRFGYTLVIYEYTGDVNNISMTHNNLLNLQTLIHSKVPNIDLHGDKDMSAFRELRCIAEEVWNEYKSRKNNLFFDIVNQSEDEQILKFREKFIEVVKG